MIFEAAAGLAAGVLLAGSIAALRAVRRATQVMRATVLLGGVVALLGVAFAVIGNVSNGSALFAPVARVAPVVIAVGGAAYGFQTKSSPFVPLTSGLLLTYAVVVSMNGPTSPGTDLAAAYLVLASACTLPALHISWLWWRKSPARTFPFRGLWLVVALALIARVWANVVWGGAWLTASARDAWLIAAWSASSGSLIVSAYRARAVLLAAAALGIAFGALST